MSYIAKVLPHHQHLFTWFIDNISRLKKCGCCAFFTTLKFTLSGIFLSFTSITRIVVFRVLTWQTLLGICLFFIGEWRQVSLFYSAPKTLLLAFSVYCRVDFSRTEFYCALMFCISMDYPYWMGFSTLTCSPGELPCCFDCVVFSSSFLLYCILFFSINPACFFRLCLRLCFIAGLDEQS